jgi:trehalose/maltose hydrolase-like predicted phosphorylase
MLFYLLSGVELGQLMERLGYSFDESVIRRTIDYYAPRTSHGSTLSNVVHSWVLARADRRRSFEFFESALEADISDVQGGTTAEGIHLGAMAGSVDLLLRGYGGIETRGDVLRFNPKLPDELATVTFSLSYRGQQLTVAIARQRVLVTSEPGPAAPVRIAVREHLTSLAPGNSVDVPLD